ncbi:MAG: hypothetical protein QXY73_05835 [Candidatus Bathyarchaeia archaeon]
MDRILLNAFMSLTLLVLLAFSMHHDIRICLGVNSDDAFSVISKAEFGVIACYRAIMDAERDRANITEMVSILNRASWLLSKAKLAYNYGDYESAVKYAGECLSMLNGFTEYAGVLRREAKEASQRDLMFNFVGAVVGVLCIIAGSYAAWLYLTRREKSRVHVN